MLNVEEFYVRDLDGYYESLQMGLHFSYYDANAQGSRSDPDLTKWINYFCGRLAEAAEQMRGEIERGFSARHPELLHDPLSELPANLRRMLAGLDQLDQPFGAAAISERFGVSSRTSREWLKRWREAGFIESTNPDAKRARSFSLSGRWQRLLDDSGSADRE